MRGYSFAHASPRSRVVLRTPNGPGRNPLHRGRHASLCGDATTATAFRAG